MAKPIIIAHRGASGTCPENTLLAFRTALEAGANWLELDTQLVDGQLVVFHDDGLERTTNGHGLLAETSLVELRKLDAGVGEMVPLLEEVLAQAVGRAQVNIELKGVGTAVATAKLLAQLFARTQLCAEDILASSLRLEELSRFQQLLPQVRRAPIYDVLPPNLDEQLQSFVAWSVHLQKSLITDVVIEQAQQQNCRVFAWTVNRVKDAERLATLGVQGIFTDYPERFTIRNA